MNPAKEMENLVLKKGELAVQWLGQAGFLLKDSEGRTLIFDPYLTDCGYRIRGFKRLTPMLIDPEELRLNYYVATHIHFDHFDFDAIPAVAKNNPDILFIGPESCMQELEKLEIPEKNRQRLDRGDRLELPGVTMEAVLADHGKMAKDAIGMLLMMGGHRLYFSGDTAFRPEVYEKVYAFAPEFSAMSVNGKFGNLTSEEGARAARMCGTAYAMPCHCYTFAEHGGDPGEFVRILKEEDGPEPVLFRQYEIRVLTAGGKL